MKNLPADLGLSGNGIAMSDSLAFDRSCTCSVRGNREENISERSRFHGTVFSFESTLNIIQD